MDVFEKIMGPLFDSKSCLFNEKKSKCKHSILLKNCANFTKKYIVKYYKTDLCNPYDSAIFPIVIFFTVNRLYLGIIVLLYFIQETYKQF